MRGAVVVHRSGDLIRDGDDFLRCLAHGDTPAGPLSISMSLRPSPIATVRCDSMLRCPRSCSKALALVTPSAAISSQAVQPTEYVTPASPMCLMASLKSSDGVLATEDHHAHRGGVEHGLEVDADCLHAEAGVLETLGGQEVPVLILERVLGHGSRLRRARSAGTRIERGFANHFVAVGVCRIEPAM